MPPTPEKIKKRKAGTAGVRETETFNDTNNDEGESTTIVQSRKQSAARITITKKKKRQSVKSIKQEKPNGKNNEEKTDPFPTVGPQRGVVPIRNDSCWGRQNVCSQGHYIGDKWEKVDRMKAMKPPFTDSQILRALEVRHCMGCATDLLTCVNHTPGILQFITSPRIEPVVHERPKLPVLF